MNDQMSDGSKKNQQAQMQAGAGAMMKKVGLTITNPAGQKLSLPANGKLLIELHDGSVQELDLTTVKKISVQQ